MRSITIIAVLVLSIFGAAQGALIQDVKPGEINVDLGDGYKASFTLPNAVSAYDIKTDSNITVLLSALLAVKIALSR